MSVDSFSAAWKYEEQTSYIAEASYAVRTHPDYADVEALQTIPDVNPVYYDTIPIGQIKPIADGRPNILTVHAVNNVGLASKIISASIVIDTTAPVEGTVTCPGKISVSWLDLQISSK